MKKITALILSICLMLSFMSISAFADTFETATDAFEAVPQVTEWYTKEDLIASREEMEEYLNYGKKIMAGNGERAYNYISIARLRQDGTATWANTRMPCGHSSHTYGAVGCAMTSYAMALNAYGYNLTPVNVATTYQNNHGACCNFNSGLLVGDYSGRSRALTSGLTSSDYNDALATIAGAIAQDRPVVVKLSGSVSHFVVCYGYAQGTSGNITISIHDPLTNGHTTLNDYYTEDNRYPISLSVVK